MVKHTPGPWIAKTGRGGWGGALPPLIQTEAGKDIATVKCEEHIYTPDENDYDADAEADRDEANARLIAASPDLYEAAKAMLGYLHDHCLPDAFVTHYEALKSAVEKAELA